MWRDKINEQKKAKNIRTKYISEFTGISEKSVTRILSGEAKNPCVDDVLAIGNAIGLSSVDLFCESTAVIGNKSLVELQEEADKQAVEIELLRAELATANTDNAALRAEICSLTAEIDILKLKLGYQEEILETHRYYMREKATKETQ